MTLLIIDDEVDILDILSEILEIEFPKVKVLTASTVEQAYLQVEAADAIISDINMPNKSSLDKLLSEFKGSVIRITGHDDTIGYPFVIQKPFETAGIKAALNFLGER